MPERQPKKGRLWLNDGSCIRLRPERANHAWAYDFMRDRTHDGRTFPMLDVVDEFTREALAIKMDRKFGSAQVLETLADLMLERGVPAYIRSDNVLCREESAAWGVRSRGVRATGRHEDGCPGGLRRQEVVSSMSRIQGRPDCRPHRPQDEILTPKRSEEDQETPQWGVCPTNANIIYEVRILPPRL